MGAGVSSWRLANAVSSLGQLGVVSGVALDVILARRLQDGDIDGSVRSALGHFPLPAIAAKIVKRYFIKGGRAEGHPYKTVPMHSLSPGRDLIELTIAANFVEVFLAREGHACDVGINYLEKIQLPLLPSIYGAMLAGVAYVLVGAGIATRIPGVLDRFTNHESATYEIAVSGDGVEPLSVCFDPAEHSGGTLLARLQRPYFFPIIASNVLATTMVKRSNGRVDGFVIEASQAGGHNAPPRGKLQLDALGQPVYGEKDVVDLARIAELGLPFWLAGGQATAEKLRIALAAGAAGIQVGTAFAFCEESGLAPDLRAAVTRKAVAGTNKVFTDPLCSPTRFPFKIVELAGTLSESDLYKNRERVCDLGFLREVFRGEDGRIGYRCASEPVDAFVSKGGDAEETNGRKCLCNALVANIGQPQLRIAGNELPLLTAGDDLVEIGRFLRDGRTAYTAADVVGAILGNS